MCLGTVARVVEVPYEGRVVVEHSSVDRAGRREEVITMTLGDALAPGDWVVIHSGFVLERISEARALDALLIRSTDPRAADPRAAGSDTTASDTTGSNTTGSDTTGSDSTDPATTPAASAAPHHKEMAP